MTDHAVTTSDGVSEAVAGPFTVRDVAVALSVVLLFLASVLPTAVIQGIGLNQWNSSNLFRLGLSILLPAMVLALFIIRRLAPKTKLRIGSLSVDQFASVVASFTTGYFFLTLVSAFSLSAAIGFIGSLGLLAATVCARWIPQFRADFAGRLETPAHPIARDAIPARAKAPKPVTAEAGQGTEQATNGSAVKAGAAGSSTRGAKATNSTGLGTKGGAAAATGAASGAAAGLSGPGTHGAFATASNAGAGAPGKDKGTRDQGRSGVAPQGRSHEAAGPTGVSGEARTGSQPHGTGAAAPSGSAADFAAPAGTGAAGVAGVAAAAEAGKADSKKETSSARNGEAAGNEDLTAPGAADGEAVGIPMSDDEVTAEADAKQSAKESSAASSARAAKDAARPQDRGEVTEADSIAGAGSRGPDAGKEQPDAGVAASGESAGEQPSASQTAPAAQTVETGRSEDRAEGRSESEMPKTAAMGSVAGASTEGTRLDAAEPISATRDHIEESDEDVTYEAFWFAVGRTRPTYDENTGEVAFMLEPGAWILALQDRGDEFLVQHTDGRVGVLRDLTNIERA
ncbi:hypothetical protein SAMN04489742_2959 [Arthrobacter crystallopoietes]|uniref:Uncharacterized protein n=2 Tax=Crystallibacter crystallopoietes TaxID=37928 RepID=A0A1H1EIS5_9MICC|nr:hypothetical protein AC20117_02675 [Arthrobacter crystallopoietes]SDQ88695.1 hypothetical protein SAMN04489742_2959 [Arthrobacter crystallopoietes]